VKAILDYSKRNVEEKNTLREENARLKKKVETVKGKGVD